MSSIKKDVLACKTVTEAQIKFARLRAIMEESPLLEKREYKVTKGSKFFTKDVDAEPRRNAKKYPGWV